MLAVVRVWILLSTLLASAGWILSAFHQLNRAGYGATFALAGIASFYWLKLTKWSAQKSAVRAGRKFLRRFKRPAPLLFLALVLMSLAAGSLYIHTNGDSNAYRIPRVWHWLYNEQWHWIHTADPRMNIVACGFEWLCAPLMLFTRTDRLIFLINIASYLMLPGLIFSVFTRLQVRPRIAWWWMWILPAGWCFALQAGSDSNDGFAAIYALASVDFALRARQRKSVIDLWFSLLAVALLTGAKQSNIPLVLPWLAAALPSFRLLLSRPPAAIFVVAASLLVSAAPATFLNIAHAGNWQGLASGTTASVWSAGSPFWKFVGNIFCIPAQNLLPPFFPWANAWNGMISRFLQTSYGAHFIFFERFGQLGAGVTETNAGLGLGVCFLTVISLVAAYISGRASSSGGTKNFSNFFLRLRIMPWLALLLFMVGICSFENARLLAPYYSLLFPLLLAGPRQEKLARRLWWQRLGLLCMLFTVLMLIISRERPLFPAVTITSRLHTACPQSNFLSRLWRSYAWTRSAGQQRIFLQKNLPQNETVVGYASAGGGAETGLWLPFGSRRVVRVLAVDTPEQLRDQGVHYVLVEDFPPLESQTTIEQWLQRYDASIVNQLEFLADPSNPARHLYLVRLNQSLEQTR